MIALMLVVLFGFLGLALDGGRGYVDRRLMQAAVDAAALAAAYDYMNQTDYAQAEQAATNQFANNQRLYTAPSCTGYGSLSASCVFGDSTNQVLTVVAADHSLAGVTFTATAVHQVPVTVMQVLGSGPTMRVGATATAVARRADTNGTAILTLSPDGCPGGSNSLTFQGNSITTVTGDIWSNGNIFDQRGAAGVYNFKGGLTQLGGFIRNELRPPDEPNLTSTTSALTGTITSIPVVALQVAVPGSSTVTVGGQAFTVTSAGAATGAASIPVA